MFMFTYALLGLIVGGVVFVAMPTSSRVGLSGSVLLGIVGGAIGGVIGTALQPPTDQALFSPMGLVLALVGSLLISVGLHLHSRTHRHA
jgi:uncharacterized membrane protein YeaQ/YmgE (transglycosylase-associated protein family)